MIPEFVIMAFVMISVPLIVWLNKIGTYDSNDIPSTDLKKSRYWATFKRNQR